MYTGTIIATCAVAALIAAGGITVTSAQQTSCLTANDNRPPNPAGRNNLYTGQQEFSLGLLNAINQLDPTGNLFFSPYSTYHALLLAYFIAGNKTEAYLRKTLRLDPKMDKADIFSAYKLDRYLQGMNKSYEFTNANRIYVADDVQTRECIKAIFEEELRAVNFRAQAEVVRKEINNWVENTTHNMIKDLLPPGTLDQETNLVLVNAAYFKGMWENKFDVQNTKQELFFITPEKQTFVDMMHVKGSFNHDVSEALQAHILELPYQGEDVSMYILLPPFLKKDGNANNVKEDGVANILKMLTIERFKSIVEEGSLVAKTVDVALPKFSLEHTIEMVPVLEKLGVGDLFSGTADFSTLTSGNDVGLGGALHKAKIELNEVGTKSAAATVLFSFRSSRESDPVPFTCNHPFVYIIYDKLDKAILFTGVFRRPF